MRKNCLMTLGMLLVALIALAGCNATTTPATDAPKSLIISSGPSGGNWYAMGASFSDVLTRAGCPTSSIPGGGTANIIAVGDGQASLAFTNLFSLDAAFQGQDPYSRTYEDICVLMSLDTNPAYVIVPANSKVNGMEDLRGMTVAGPNPGTSAQFCIHDCLAAAGLNEDTDLTIKRGSMSESAEQFKDRLVDAYLITTGVGNSTIMDIATSMDVKFISLDEETIATLIEMNPGYRRLVIPANTYKGQAEDIVTVTSDAALIANTAMSEDDAYWITKTIAEHLADIQLANGWLKDVTVESMGLPCAIPMHPGAEKYYSEVNK